jgi:hypothetical protein
MVLNHSGKNYWTVTSHDVQLIESLEMPSERVSIMITLCSRS